MMNICLLLPARPTRLTYRLHRAPLLTLFRRPIIIKRRSSHMWGVAPLPLKVAVVATPTPTIVAFYSYVSFSPITDIATRATIIRNV